MDLRTIDNPVAGGAAVVLHEVAYKTVGVFKKLATKTHLSARLTDLLFPGDALVGRLDFTAGHDVEVITVEVVLRCHETAFKKKQYIKEELLVKKIVKIESDNSTLWFRVKVDVVKGSRVRVAKGTTVQWPFQIALPTPPTPHDVYPPSWEGYDHDSIVGNQGTHEGANVRYTLTSTVISTGETVESTVELLVGSSALLPPRALEFVPPHCVVEAGAPYNTCCCCGGRGAVEYRVELPHRVGLAGSSRAAGGLPLRLGAVAHGAPIAASAVYLKSRFVVSHTGAVRSKQNFLAADKQTDAGDFKDKHISDTAAKLVLGSKDKQVPHGFPRSAGPLTLDAVPLLPVFSKELPPSFVTGNIQHSWFLVYETDAALCSTAPTVEVPIWVTNNPAAVPAGWVQAAVDGPAAAGTGAGKD